MSISIFITGNFPKTNQDNCILYFGFTIIIKNQYEQKTEEADAVLQDTTAKLAEVNSDIDAVKAKTNEYTQLADNLQSTSERIQEDQSNKNVIPTMLSEIMFIIPQDVQLTSIENTTDKHIVINAQSEQYEQLGYFKVKLANENILKADTVVSTMGTKEGDMVKIVIEGDLP